MNKEENLLRSKKENSKGEEREKSIERESYKNACLAIMAINALLMFALLLQKLFTGKEFADYQVFFLPFLIAYTAQFATKYKYSKSKKHLCLFGLGILASLTGLLNIISKGMGWF